MSIVSVPVGFRLIESKRQSQATEHGLFAIVRKDHVRFYGTEAPVLVGRAAHITVNGTAFAVMPHEQGAFKISKANKDGTAGQSSAETVAQALAPGKYVGTVQGNWIVFTPA